MHVHRRSTLLAVVVVVTAAGCAAPLTQRERTTVGGGVGALEESAATGDDYEFETRQLRDLAADREIQAHEREIRRQRAAIAEIRRRQQDDAYDRFDDDRYDRDDDRYHSSDGAYDGYAPD